jgi:uncharacterized membrane protein YphA (DoxX/SURF4 family)
MQVAEKQSVQQSVKNAPRSSLARRVASRFVCVYMVLYHIDPLLDVAKPLRQSIYRAPLRALDSWFATHVLHLGAAVANGGWGGRTDTPLYYIHVLLLLVFAVAAAVIWSSVDRRRSVDDSLHPWVRLLVRYSLASALVTYGLSKVFVVQMAPMWMYLSRLVEPFGNMSPAGLLWAFIGYSTPYQIFSGVAEVVPGVLLLFRRTTTLGALIAAAVLTNVVMLNLSYQVDVKVFSVNLLAAAIFLAAPELPRLARFFVLNMAVIDAPVSSAPVFDKRGLRVGAVVLQVAFVSLLFYQNIQLFAANSLFRRPSDAPALLGIWNVESFVQNGTEHAPLATDSIRWKVVDIDYASPMQVQLMDGSFRAYNVEYDKNGQSVTVFAGRAKKGGSVLQCSRPDPDHLVMEGKLGADALRIRLARVDLSRFSLLNSQLHWTGRTDIH